MIFIFFFTDSDITANDGVYSAYFTHFYSASRYTVKVRADDQGGKAFINTEFQGFFSGANPVEAGMFYPDQSFANCSWCQTSVA